MNSFTVTRFSGEDIQTRVNWMNDPGVQAGLNVSGSIDTASTAEWLSRIEADPNRIDLVLRLDGRPVGMSGLTGISQGSSTAELYAFVDPRWKRRGFGSRLVRETCRLGFDEIGLYRIYLWMFATNSAATSLYSKAGFQLEGVLRQHAVRDGRRVDRHVMGMLHPEWSAQQSRA